MSVVGRTRARWVVAVVVLASVATACADGGADVCVVAADPLPAFDGADSVARWRAIADAADGELADAATSLAVVAREVRDLGPDAGFQQRADLVLRPIVVHHLETVQRELAARCPR